MQTEVVLQGITKTDIQKILEDTIKQFKVLPKIIYLDTSYLYTFDVSDILYINKFTDMIRTSYHNGRNPLAVLWHECLEGWFMGRTITIFNQPIKPIAISRTMDRVPNEGLEALAGGFTATTDFAAMKWHELGSGAEAGTSPSPGATALVTPVDRIDVNEDSGGGSLTRDGSTIFCIGNHDVFMESANLTETGIFDAEHTDHDLMGDYSIFPDEIPHTSGQDSPGSTTVIYSCST